MLFQIFTAQASDASSLVVNHGGGQVEIVVGGSFGGGTVTAVARFPGTGAWVPLDGGEWTVPAVKLLATIRPCEIRLDLVGASGASLNAWV